MRNLFTIVIVPRRTEKVKRIYVPIIIGVLSLFLLGGLIFGWTFVLQDYLTLRDRLTNFEALEKEHQTRLEQFGKLSEGMNSVEEHFDTLSALNHKLKQMMMQSGEKQDILPESEMEIRKDRLARVEKEGIISIIASDSAEIDAELKYEQEIKFENLTRFFTKQHNPFSRIPSISPVKGYIVQKFGTSYDPYTGESRPQAGIDITTHNYHPIQAPADGIVMSQSTDETFGNMMVIDHGNGFSTRYGHISRYEVAEGEMVTRGSTIALTGNTGHTTGPRLRFEVLFNNVPMDPEKFATN